MLVTSLTGKNKNLFWICMIFIFSVCFNCSSDPQKSLSKLKSEIPDVKEFHITAEDRKIFLVTSGCLKNKNKILIFIHGSPGGWSDYIFYLKDKDLRNTFCILSLDRPGFGLSGIESPVADLQLQARLIRIAIDRFLKDEFVSDLPKLILVGHSYGGPIAAKIAIDISYKKDALFLLSAPMDSQLEEVRWYNRWATYFFVKIFLPKEIINSNDEMIPLKWQLTDWDGIWKFIDFPVISIHGKNDFLVPFENVKYMRKKINPLRFESIELEGENHFVPWTQEKLVKDKILMVNSK
ncbi:alpha/beta hydrolase [Leptospira kobayashii]|uniref:Alpha/beta hydrolase n=1 Tax=Leptospira kobayashii TaxID=1917830 RepID=A0ABN6KGG7_9LEPT|nr:alpha/beta hydrolase [Leptospira kobayashii]BDA80314.1 alpha/beta hydrolase [Leptospira kobayashii]